MAVVFFPRKASQDAEIIPVQDIITSALDKMNKRSKNVIWSGLRQVNSRPWEQNYWASAEKSWGRM